MPDDLASKLEFDIIFGRLPPGSRLIEDRIMERYAAKRHAVRAAFSMLETRGLLNRKPNCGVEVVNYTPDQVDDFYEIRLILEKSAAARTKLPVDPAIVTELEEYANLHRQAVIGRDDLEVFLLNRKFHSVQYACCGNEQLYRLIEEYARIVEPIRVVKYQDEAHMAVIVQQHFRIIEAMKTDNSDAYVREVAEHLPASAQAYRAVHERRFGTIRTDPS